MAQVNPTIDDENRDASAYRIGQPYTYANCRLIADRDPYGRLIVRDLVQEALGAGFDVVDPTTEEPLDNSEEIWQIIEKDWEQFITGWELQRTFEKSVVAIFTRDNPEAKGAPFLRAFEPKDIEKDQLKFYDDGSLKGIKLRKHAFDGKQDEWYYLGEVETPTKVTAENIDNAYYVIDQKKRKYWIGRSELEAVWDIIWGLRYIHMGCIIFAIRKGSGLRLIILPPGKLSDEDKTEMKTFAKTLDSFDAYALIPHGSDVKVDASGQADYNALKDTLLRALSAKLKIPKARLDGIEPGNLDGARVNEEAMFDVWRSIQRLAAPMVKWLVERYNVHYKWFADGTKWKPLFRIRAELSEKEKADVLGVNVTAYSDAISVNLISIKNAQKELGFPEEEVENPVPMIAQLGIKNEEEEEDQEDDNQDRESDDQSSTENRD